MDGLLAMGKMGNLESGKGGWDKKSVVGLALFYCLHPTRTLELE